MESTLTISFFNNLNNIADSKHVGKSSPVFEKTSQDNKEEQLKRIINKYHQKSNNVFKF